MWSTSLHPAFTVAGSAGVSMMPLVDVQPPTWFPLPQPQQQPQQQPLKMTPGGGPPPGPGSQAVLIMYQPSPQVQTMGASSRMGTADGGAPVGPALGSGATSGSRCHFCKEAISGDQYIRTDIMVCHSDCFRCSICCTGMSGMRAFRLGSRICCQQCFRTLTVCAYCGGPIINGKSWVEFNNQAYHPSHLFCTAPGCGVALGFESGYALSDHRLPVCPAHHPNAVACAVCGCLVVGEGIQLSDRAQLTLRHPECFMCSFCGFLLSWDYIIDQYGRPLCSDHIDMARSFQQLKPKPKPKVNWQVREEESKLNEEEVEPVRDSRVDRQHQFDEADGRPARRSHKSLESGRADKQSNTVRRPSKGILKSSQLNNASNLSASEDDSHASFHLRASRSNCEADDAWETEASSEEEVAPEYDDFSFDWQEGQEASCQPVVACTPRYQSPSTIPASSSSRSSSWAAMGSSAAASSRSRSCQRTLSAASVQSLEMSQQGRGVGCGGCGGGIWAALPASPAAPADPHGELSPSAASLLAKSD